MQIEYRGHWVEVVELQREALGWTALATGGPKGTPASFDVMTPQTYETELEAFVAVVRVAKRRIAQLLSSSAGNYYVPLSRRDYAHKLRAISASHTAPRAPAPAISEPLIDVFPGFAACPQAVRYFADVRKY
ncbi:hypothetical protein GCM10007242_41820 [Pigmentiphaga litoralis]|uniref:hypothetical protein n=1 Tax=Pigmentiphaga litoralis TaxID=516702 RepID=UPI001678444B|nr:hypothetical protein [Pigmentiphaga litoralis]GGX30749.1 hypothetical protein GCM10007242_41820 [Pigmentiphaga litoralis]